MILTIPINSDTKEKLEKKSKAIGLSLDGYVKLVIAKDLVKDNLDDQESISAIDEMLDPVRKEVLEKGISEKELDSSMYSLLKIS